MSLYFLNVLDLLHIVYAKSNVLSDYTFICIELKIVYFQHLRIWIVN